MPDTLDRPITEAFITQPPQVLAAYNLIESVEKFRGYGENWGTYGEKAVKSFACDQAIAFISVSTFLKPTVSLHVYPTSGGNIGIDWDLDSQSFTAVFTGAEVRFLIDNGTPEEMVEQEYQAQADLLNALKLYGFSGV